MVSKNLFSTKTGKVKTSRKTPNKAEPANARNMAGGESYQSTTKHALAQIACTGTFNGTFYATGNKVLELCTNQIKNLVAEGGVEFLAKLAVYGRTSSYMKDLPSYFLVELYHLDKNLFKRVFNKVVDNGKMLRNVVRIARSGVVNGHKINLSNKVWRTVIQNWFDSQDGKSLFYAAIGNDPTLQDIIKMARVKPKPEFDALFKYFLGKDYNVNELPELVKSYIMCKNGDSKELPNVDFRYLANLDLGTKEWTQIALNAGFNALRMNLNTFQRHGVLGDKEVVSALAAKLRDEKAVKYSKVFPYQLMMTYLHATDMPYEINSAVQDAMEIATQNVPVFQGDIAIAVDVSGSMNSPVTGNIGTATSKATCVHVAALFASVFLRNNKNAKVMPFDTSVKNVNLNPRDSVVTNTQLLSINGGGTDCSVALRELNRQQAKLDAIVMVSDNESWRQSDISIDRRYYIRGTNMMQEWVEFKKRNPNAKMVLIDLTPSVDSQLTNHTDILMVGGWSDEVFNVVDNFLGQSSMDAWVEKIEKVEI